MNVLSVINGNMNRFLNNLGTFLVNTISFNRGIGKKYTFITPLMKFTNVFPTIVVDEALTLKGFEI